ncbi:P-type conjugative transfer protein VirB9 [Photobacterium phosphoreum]|jgi:type IV secretion system protein VirB9|uniref:P-type conjugative transfer protein VirB9 n=1 Tax=Photobacterium phosphoreum TaxID=659 RepID=UPI000D16F5D5|nr:P-type conjugative transfer protein VirB9 [Photobacterium phosphoreum]PSU67905.1 P-type conjugative transfer protein VirB9 [Photobacterium phosphoreum]PSW07910.1 P-type conjugative transfer protein VirB9 [Photobacterium phosphoreum]
MKITLLSLCLCTLAANSYALDVPNQSSFDSNIQFTRFNNDNVVALTAYEGMITHLILAPDEVVIAKPVGFEDGWSVETQANHVFIKPIAVKGTTTNAEGNPIETVVQPNAKQWQTNLTLVTNKRSYAFLLTLGTGQKGRVQNTFRLTFDYSAPTPPKAVTTAISKQKALVDAKKVAISPKNWQYAMQVGDNSANIAPIKAMDDGRFTYLTFAPNSEIPAIFISDEAGKESLVNTHISPDALNTVVIQRVAQQWVLRLDKAVVGVTNNGLNTVPVNTQNGTSLSTLKRTVKS